MFVWTKLQLSPSLNILWRLQALFLKSMLYLHHYYVASAWELLTGISTAYCMKYIMLFNCFLYNLRITGFVLVNVSSLIAPTDFPSWIPSFTNTPSEIPHTKPSPPLLLWHDCISLLFKWFFPFESIPLVTLANHVCKQYCQWHTLLIKIYFDKGENYDLS